jgi:hypothetical protein
MRRARSIGGLSGMWLNAAHAREPGRSAGAWLPAKYARKSEVGTETTESGSARRAHGEVTNDER